MVVGHYAASFVGKAAAPAVPLWVLLLAAQLVDVAWAVLILLGIERFHLDPALPSNPLVLEHMPYTHSLVATLRWAAFAAVAVATAGLASARTALVVGLVVASHWVSTSSCTAPISRSGVPSRGSGAGGRAASRGPRR